MNLKLVIDIEVNESPNSTNEFIMLIEHYTARAKNFDSNTPRREKFTQIAALAAMATDLIDKQQRERLAEMDYHLSQMIDKS